MFVLHGRQAIGAFAPASLPVGSSLGQPGTSYLPLPPLQSVSISLPSGIQPVYQLGVTPLKDIVNIQISPHDVTFTFPLAQDYPYYEQLISLLTKDPLTNHYPPLDLRIYLGETFLDGKHTVIDSCGCIVRKVTFSFRESVATLTVSFSAVSGVLYATPSEEIKPPAMPMLDFPARKVTAYCRITYPTDTPPEESLADFLSSPAKYSIISASVDVNISIRLVHTLPTLSHAFWGWDSPLLPTSIPATVHEGTETYSGEITLALPPATPQPPVATIPSVYDIYIITDGGLVVALKNAKIASISPAISSTSSTSFSLSLQGMGVRFFML